MIRDVKKFPTQRDKRKACNTTLNKIDSLETHRHDERAVGGVSHQLNY